MSTNTVQVRLPGTPAELVARMGTPQVAQARIDADPLLSTALTTLDPLDDATGRMAYATVSQIPSGWLPGPVARAASVLPSVHRAERWQLLPEGSAEAEVELEIHGVPADARGHVTLAPVESGEGPACELTYTVELAVHIPIVGGLVESVVLHRIADTIRAEAQVLATDGSR